MGNRVVMGRAVPADSARQMNQSAINAPPPASGEVRRTAVPDDFNGIRFEIARMVRHVQAAENDPIVRAHVEEVCGKYLDKVSQMSGGSYPKDSEATLCVQAIDEWCREHYVYVNDPPNIEIIQTPARMIKQTKVPQDVISYLLSPFYDEFAAYDAKVLENYVSPDMYIGDCDEGSECMTGMAIVVPGARPIYFRFGGNKETLHHVWAQVGADGQVFDSDHTEPGYTLGQFSKFENYETAEVAA